MVFCSSLILPISCYKEDLNKQDFYREYCQHDNSEPQSGSLLFNFFPPSVQCGYDSYVKNSTTL